MTGGLHHITGITADAQANADFYAELLGLVPLLKTVNHSDPETLHLFYGDAAASPGSLLTFFVWPAAGRGRRGAGAAAGIGLRIPRTALPFWLDRFLTKGITYRGPSAEDGATVLQIEDPDGLPVTLVGLDADGPPRAGAGNGTVPPEAAVSGLHHVDLWSEQPATTGQVLSSLLGYRESRPMEGGGVHTGADGTEIRLHDSTGFWSSAEGAGLLQHTAFRVPDNAALSRLTGQAEQQGLETSGIREHGFFASTYFREPGGALIELATDGPGLGRHDPDRLTLPAELEHRRAELEVSLPPVVTGAGPRPLQRELSWVHRWLPGSSPVTLLLLHGSGGSEASLLHLGRDAHPQASLLGARGGVLEDGSVRFYRNVPGYLGKVSLEESAKELAAFTEEAARAYAFPLSETVPVGYSNGANITLGLLAVRPDLVTRAVLLRPALPWKEPPAVDLTDRHVLVLLGEDDEFLEQGRKAAAWLEKNGAQVDVRTLPAGHDLTPADHREAAAWFSGTAG